MPDILSTNLSRIRERIGAAASRSDRSLADVRLIAVTKYVGPEVARELVQLGVADLGENRLSVAEPKIQGLSDLTVCWHWIGRVQTNKTRKILDRFTVIHSVDRIELVESIEQHVAPPNRVPVFLQVNVSGEASKAGAGPDDAIRVGEKLIQSTCLEWLGLMTMAPDLDDPEETRPVFAATRELRDRIEKELGVVLPRLSMGMSHDFEIAVEEGATDVRIGSSLFSGLQAHGSPAAI